MMWFKSPRQRRLERMTPEQLREEAERAARYAGELLQRKPSRVEELARAYCRELGYDPDGYWATDSMMPPAKLWMKYRNIAEAALHKEAMERALAQVAQAAEVTTTP